MDGTRKRGRSGSGSRKSRSSGSRSSSNKTKKNKPLTLNEKLINACFDGEQDIAIRLLLQGANANYIDPLTGYTPLLIACEINNIKLVKFLIKRGANVNLQGFQGGPFPLDLSKGSIKNLLLKKGAIGTVERPKQLHMPTIEIKKHSNPLIYKDFDSLFTRLSIRIRNRKNYNKEREGAIATLNKIINVRNKNPRLYDSTPSINLDQLNEFGNTLLEEACLRNKLDIVTLLIQAGANVNEKSKGFTPLGTAIVLAEPNSDSYKHSIQIIAELVKAGADVNMKYGKNSFPLTRACFDGNVDIVQILLSSPNKNVNLIDDDGDTPLTAAIESTMKNKNQVSCNDAIKIIKLLIAHGADVNLQNSEGELPTDVARKNGSCPALETVLAHYGAQFSMGPPRSGSSS